MIESAYLVISAPSLGWCILPPCCYYVTSG